MLKHTLWGIVVFFMVCPLPGQSQQVDSLYKAFDKMYGMDATLNNGRKYIPDGAKVRSHPFWGDDGYFTADVTISGKTFKKQHVKYNLDKQDFLLSYTDLNGQSFQIILNTSLIDSVKSQRGVIVRNPYPEIGYPLVEKIYKGKIACFAGLRKKLEFATIGVNTGYSYSDEAREFYIVYKGTVFRFDNKSTFLKIFPSDKRSVIRNKISRLKLRFRKIDNELLRQLVEFCDHTVA